MLREIQAMNHNIAMMLANQIKEEKRFVFLTGWSKLR
jgi:hypothetical protein